MVEKDSRRNTKTEPSRDVSEVMREDLWPLKAQIWSTLEQRKKELMKRDNNVEQQESSYNGK
jgi:hypothetical protein